MARRTSTNTNVAASMAPRIMIAVVAALVLFGAPWSASASILLTDNFMSNIEQMLNADGEACDPALATCSTGTPRPSQFPDGGQNEDEPSDRQLAELLTLNSPMGGTSSSGGTSSAGASSSAPSAFLCSVAPMTDADVVTWACSEQRFSLPMPPGNDLLRPPQG